MRKPLDFAEFFFFLANSHSENGFVTCPLVGDFGCHFPEINFSPVISSPGGPGMVNGLTLP